eukprot:TRINITY_DN1417_c0_g1_i3.p1 TRINITY_DN1417_c0_g1~~TRINITY_DN1417_c0_g1_i3.p1  ORF type:complete len:163 (-),score=40.36 TRINITY_DN1417_c0_g1_i3:125-613(-)
MFIACKSEESPRKLREIINVAFKVQHPEAPVMKIDNDYWTLRDALTQCEHQVLLTLNFELETDLPFRYLLNYVKSMQLTQRTSQIAWNVCCDSFRTLVPLQMTPTAVACAAIELALRTSGEEPPYLEWWRIFEEDKRTIDGIIAQVAVLYDKQMQPAAVAHQ